MAMGEILISVDLLLVCLCLLEISHVIISRVDFYFLSLGSEMVRSLCEVL